MGKIADTNKNAVLMQEKGHFTDAQFEVIKHSEGNLLVSASAGSGKTSILIEKIVRLILGGGVKLKRLLVVTFTNNASLEIKQRLYKSLSESNNEKLFEELDDLSTSDILTFDSFCIKVVKEFGYTIGRNNNFSVADEALSGFLKNQALDNVFTNHNKNFDEKFKNFINNFFESRNEKSVRTSIARLYDFLRSKENSNVYSSQLENLYSFDANNEAFKYIGKYFLNLKDYMLSQLEKLKLEANILSENKLAEKIIIAQNQLILLNGDFMHDFSFLRQDINFPVISKNAAKDCLEVLELKSKYQKLISSFKEKVNDVFSAETKMLSIDTLYQDLQKTKNTLKYIFEIIDEFDREYTKLKNNHQVLDFNDIEKLVSQILKDKKITQAIQNRYDWIFIDEYQDTSGLQESIVKKITTGENLFMVGDFKQSIYRFRQAEPTIFINKYNEYKDLKSSSSVIELKTNFRSENAILKFNNFVFDKIYKKSLDDFDYLGNADLEFGGKIERTSNNPLVKVLLIDKKKKVEIDEDENNVNEDEFTKDDDHRVYSVKDSNITQGEKTSIQKQALLLASEIKDMLGKPFYDVKSKTTRYIDYKDIAVLSRNKSGVILELRKVLNEVGIPVTAQYSENIFESYDMQILFGILSAINNPNDDFALLTTFVNIGDFSFGELATIRKEYKTEHFFYVAVSKYLEEHNDTISQKITNCFEKLERYRLESTHKNICELINFIVQSENLDTYFAVNDGSEEFFGHISVLTSSIQSIKDYSLSSFLNYIDTFGGNLEQDNTIKDGENSVTLINIHRSKGLEYPVVFLVATEKQFSNRDITEKILTDNEWGISMSSFDYDSHSSYENIVKNIFKQKIKTEDKKEEKRLLYVALTRPKSYLTIIGATDTNKLSSNNNDFEINEAKCYLDWIMGCFSNDTLEKLKANKNIEVLIDDEEKVLLEIASEDEFSFSKEFVDKTLPKNLVIDKNRFVEILSQKFEHNNLSKKNSVTQIMQENEHYNITDFSYKRNDKANDEDFLAIGTAYHKFMQFIDFCDDEDALKEQIENFKQLGKFSYDELSSVDVNDIIKAAKIIHTLIGKDDIVLKEQQFLTYMPASNLIDSKKQNKILVQGVADLIIIKKDEIYLIDYKTSRLSKDMQFIEKYKTQLDIYAKSIESFYNKPVTKKAVYSFYLNKLIII